MKSSTTSNVSSDNSQEDPRSAKASTNFCFFIASLKALAFHFPESEDTESHLIKACKPHKDFKKSCAVILGESCLSNFSLIGANRMILAFDP